MNGGTSLRSDSITSRRVKSMHANPSIPRRRAPPLSRRICRFGTEAESAEVPSQRSAA